MRPTGRFSNKRNYPSHSFSNSFFFFLHLEGEHSPDVKEQALCILANIADGETAKEFIMSNEDVLRKLTNYMVYLIFIN